MYPPLIKVAQRNYNSKHGRQSRGVEDDNQTSRCQTWNTWHILHFPGSRKMTFPVSNVASHLGQREAEARRSCEPYLRRREESRQEHVVWRARFL